MSAAPPRVAIVLIAAVAENGVIGRENKMPWHLSSDLKHFRAATMGKPVVMGRKTFLSIGKPLEGRTNIVVTRDRAFVAPGVVSAANLENALAVARADALRRNADAIAVIGGTEIFVQTMPLAARLEITEVHARPDGDTHFPEIDRTVWREVERGEHPAGPRDDAAYSRVTYIRVERRL